VSRVAVSAAPASTLLLVPNVSDPSDPSASSRPEFDAGNDTDGASGESEGVRSSEERVILPYSLVRAATAHSQVARVWTPLGTVDAGVIADCDPAGMVQMRGERWSVDWWIGAEDRWHYPSLDAAVRQRRIGDSPVIETAMRVPGGDIIQRVFGVRATSAQSEGSIWDDSALVIEIENLTAVPVALAILLRPFLLDGPGSLSSLTSEGSVLSADGQVAAVLSKPVARRVVGKLGTVAARLANGDDEGPDGTTKLQGASLEGAFIVALPHTAVVRILLPRSTRDSAPRRSRKGSAAALKPRALWEAPDAAAIEAGWTAHTKDAARIELPDSLLDRVVTRSERVLLLAATEEFFTASGPASAAVGAAELCDALVRAGVSEPLGPLARALLSLQRVGGSLRMPDRSDATVALVHAAVPLLAGKKREVWAEELVGPVAKAIHRLAQAKGIEGATLTRSAAIALGRVAPSLRFVGQPEVAEAAERAADNLWELWASTPFAGPVNSSGSVDGWLLAEGLELRLALAASNADALPRILELGRLGEQAGLCDRIDTAGMSCGTMAIHPAALAARMAAIFDLALLEQSQGLVILPIWSDSWFGAPIEAHGLRTRWGVVSFAIRWHGERPAVLWEVIPGPGVDPSGLGPKFTAPGLDTAWSAQGWTGDALLAPIGPVVLTEASQASGSALETARIDQGSAGAAPAPAGSAPAFQAPREGDSFT